MCLRNKLHAKHRNKGGKLSAARILTVLYSRTND